MVVALMDVEEWGKEQENPEENSEKKEKTKCACGNAVCCGKHKGGRCSCKCKQKERS